MTKSGFFCNVSTVAAMLACAAVPAPVAAQPAAPAASSDTEVAEIIVTAQRREQGLQDVPIVVTSVNGQLLQDAGVRDIKDLTVLTPGLMVTSTSNESITSARIRGVGTVGDNPGLESSVGVLIDGVYRPRNGVGFGDLGETQRIEVLKGPQGTLFGKNTSSGVINILTTPPSFDFGATSEATVGNFGAVGFSNSITGPLSDTVAGKIYVAARKRDGFQSTFTAGGPRIDNDNNQNFYTGRAQVLFKPSDSFSARIIADYTKRDEDCCLGVDVVNGQLSPIVSAVAAATGRAPALLSPPNPDSRLTYANRNTVQKIEDKGVSAELNWHTPYLGGATLTSVTAMRGWKTLNGQDIDFTTLDLLYRDPNGGYFRKFSTFSQEFRLAGETEKANWLVGGFYSKERLHSGEQQIAGTQLELYFDQLFRAVSAPGTPVFLNGIAAITGRPLGTNAPPGITQDDRYNQDADSLAVFGNVSYKLTEALELTGGIRFTSEKKNLESDYRNPNGGVAAASCSPLAINTSAVLGGSLAAPNVTLARLYAGYLCRPGADAAYNNLTTFQTSKENKISGTAKLVYRFSSDAMAYASYARGYKGGGFNLDRVRIATVAANPSGIGLPNLDTSFAPELVDSYELGSKTSWFGRSLLLNATVFYQTFKNYQLNAFDGIAFTVTSIPKVVTRGVDADLIWKTPVHGFSLQGGVTYAESQYADARPASPTFALPSAANPTGGGLYRLPGTRLSFAPLWSGSLAATFEHQLPWAIFRANLTGKYTSSFNTGSDLLPAKTQKALTLVNGRMGFSSLDERWTLEVWGLNLGDKTYYQVAFDGPLQNGQVDAFLGAPRTWGGTLRFKY